MTLSKEKRAAIEERHKKRHHPDIDIRFPQLVADHVSDMAKDISDLLQALREAEAEIERLREAGDRMYGLERDAYQHWREIRTEQPTDAAEGGGV